MVLQLTFALHGARREAHCSGVSSATEEFYVAGHHPPSYSRSGERHGTGFGWSFHGHDLLHLPAEVSKLFSGSVEMP